MLEKLERAKIILEQLGDNRFIAMTGSKNFIYTDKGLRMTLTKNLSKANRLEITLNDSDTYDMKFYRVTGTKIDTKKEYQRIYADQLQELFTEATGLDTHL